MNLNLKSKESGFSPTDFLAIALCVVPTVLVWCGGKLFFRLYAGFLPRIRRSLIKYFAVVVVYCSIWLFSTFSRDGMHGMMFTLGEQVIGVVLLLIPFLTVLLMKPDFYVAQILGNGEAEQNAALNH